MFTLKRPHRQTLATVALVVLTIVPTVYVAITAWRINRPAHVRAVESELGRQLGLRVTLEAVRHPRPGEDAFRNVILRQEELHGKQATEVARADDVRVLRNGHNLTLEVAGLRLSGESPKQAMAQVGALLQRVGDGLYRRVNLTARECEIELGQGGGSGAPALFLFRDVVGTFDASPTAPTLTVSYRVPGEGSSTRCELSLTRDRQGPAVRTTLVFKSMDGLPLPARVLDPFFDTNNWLGRSARAEGSLTLRQTGTSEWEAEFQGTLHDVDLAALVDRQFRDHRLTGLARIRITQARWAERPGGQGVGWVNAEGELSAGPGSIGIGLVKAL